MHNYSSLDETHEPEEEGAGVRVHVAEPSRSRWNHIEDLDSFFSRMYQYHQRHGFFCMLLQEIMELIQFVFIVLLTAYIFHGINYPILFRTIPPPNNSSKVTLGDVILPFSDCVTNFTALTWFALCIASIVGSLKLLRGVYQFYNFFDIKQFYNCALKIEDNELDNLTWHEVQTKIITVQLEQQMCIHKRELSELDIYHRILRQLNYFVAMINKRLLPPRLSVPLIGEVVYWTVGLRLNIQLLLFWSPCSLFEHTWRIREEFKKPQLRHDLAKKLGRQILWLATANLIFSPIIFLWQLLYAFFSYAAIIRKEPSVLAVRKWSLYGRLYLRHFNELEHELQARLTRAHRPATKYLGAFTSPVSTIISEIIGFFATAFLAVFVILSLIDEDVLAVEHVISIMTILTVIVAIVRKIVPDETTSSDLEDLLTKVVAHTHYLPSDWSGQAHTTRVRKEFEQLFQYGFVTLLESILSPLITPYVLWRHIYPRSLEIVDFFRNFTVIVVGVGDVCSFAQMDVRKHGNPEWHGPVAAEAAVDQYSQCEDGKVELSLVHFKCKNPSWMPPESVREFVKNVQNQSSMIAASLSDQQVHGSTTPQWHIGDPCDVPLHSSTIWRDRMGFNDNDTTEVKEMAMNATYLHSLHSIRGRGAQETTPLLGSNR